MFITILIYLFSIHRYFNNLIYFLCLTWKLTLCDIKTLFNPIRSGGGGALKAPPPIFCSHAFNFGAALLCVGDFSQKIV